MQTDQGKLQTELARLRPGMLRWVQSRGGSPDLAEEVVQQALLRALEYLPRLRQAKHLKAWFQVIVKNTLNDELRRQQKLLPLEQWTETAQDTEAPAAEAQEGCSCVLDLLKSIRPAYAELLETVDLQEQSLQRAATSLGITANNAGVRLHRARQALKDKLKQTCGTDSVAACEDCSCSACA